MVGWLVVINGISTLIGYLILNSVYSYTLNIFCWLGVFYGISNFVRYVMPNLVYTYALNIYGWLVGCVLQHINPYRLFNAISCLCIYILNIYDL